jgi:hypothetical protein
MTWLGRASVDTSVLPNTAPWWSLGDRCPPSFMCGLLGTEASQLLTLQLDCVFLPDPRRLPRTVGITQTLSQRTLGIQAQ